MWALDGDSGAMKPVLRPYLSLRGMWHSFSKPVSHVPSVERDTELHSDDSLNSRALEVVVIESLPGAYPAKVIVKRIARQLFLSLVMESVSRAVVLVTAYATTNMESHFRLL